MKSIKIVLLVAALAVANALQAQTREEMSRHDRARYDQMNSEGVWSVGIDILPVVPLSHPISPAFGGGRHGCVGSFGFGVEGGYFVVDNMRLSAELNYGTNSSGMSMLLWNGVDARVEQSLVNFTLGAHWHMGRWDVGGGIVWGSSKLNYLAPNVAEDGKPVEGLGLVGFNDRRKTFGLSYEGNYMISPFMKVGAFFRPMITTAGPCAFVAAYGIKATINLPFINAVVCR